MSRWFAPALGIIEVRGRDRVTWLAGLITSDLSKLGPSRGSYGLVLSKVGRILTDACVLVDGERLLVGVSAPVAELLAHLEHHLVMEDVDLADASGEGAMVFVLDAGDVGAELMLGVEGARALWVPAGTTPPGDQLTGDQWETLRLAAGVPAFGADFDAKTYPQEAALEARAVSFEKGCYLGQEVVCRLQMRGQVHRLLVPFEADGPPPAHGVEVLAAGAPVGTVTSATIVDGKVRGLAMVKRASAAPGASLQIDGRAARVVER